MNKLTETKQKILEEFDKIFGDEDYPAKGTVSNYKDFLDEALDTVQQEVLKEVEQKMLERILYIGDEIPQGVAEDKRNKFVLLGYPGEFLTQLGLKEPEKESND